MVNLSGLQDIDPLNISVNLTNTEILETAVTSANEVTGGYYGLGLGIALYLILMYLSTKDQSGFSYDFVKASVMSSAIVITVMLILLALDLIGSFLHLMWFVVIYILSLLGSYVLKDSE